MVWCVYENKPGVTSLPFFSEQEKREIARMGVRIFCFGTVNGIDYFLNAKLRHLCLECTAIKQLINNNQVRSSDIGKLNVDNAIEAICLIGEFGMLQHFKATKPNCLSGGWFYATIQVLHRSSHFP